ncbi:MAG TPA: HD domain-containing protein [Bryobacteraceae bacterium]|jgi:3'-5' exoribonuclease|nr:HD domain-containing protein [Bryobacteraceae bacterium]
MKSPFIDNLVPNEVVTAQFLVLSKEIRQKKSGEPYLSLHLADRTGEIEAKMWDNVAEIIDTFERDHFVKVKGLPQLYNNRSQFVIHRLRRLDDHEVDFADYFPCSDRNPDEMFAELQSIISGLGNPHLRSLLTSIFADEGIASRYKIAPAAKSIHHACRSGLLEHVLSLCTLSQLLAGHYPEVDRDLLLTGIILHDIGKLEELTYARSFGYSAEGQLLGHIVLGLRLVANKLEGHPDFPPRLRTLVEHLITSHHGELEFGSPKVPLFPEAILLHHLDNLDSKMNAARAILKRDSYGTAEFTPWVPSLERVLLHKNRYLSNTVPVDAPGTDATWDPPAPEPPAAAREPSAAPAPQPLPSHPETPSPMPGAPGIPAAPPPARKPQEPHQTNTLFGEKLQAVLSGRK